MGLTLQELYTIKAELELCWTNHELSAALPLIKREIKLKEIDPVTGKKIVDIPKPPINEMGQ